MCHLQILSISSSPKLCHLLLMIQIKKAFDWEERRNCDLIFSDFRFVRYYSAVFILGRGIAGIPTSVNNPQTF